MLIKKNTVMPLSSGTPGISIRTSAVEGRPGSRYRRTITRLTLHPEMYDILEVGDNYFCCKGFLEGNSSSPVQRFVDFFIVRKKKPKRRNAKRWVVTPILRTILNSAPACRVERPATIGFKKSQAKFTLTVVKWAALDVCSECRSSLLITDGLPLCRSNHGCLLWILLKTRGNVLWRNND